MGCGGSSAATVEDNDYKKITISNNTRNHALLRDFIFPKGKSYLVKREGQ